MDPCEQDQAGRGETGRVTGVANISHQYGLNGTKPFKRELTVGPN